jgi:hypothetical protein
MHLTHFSTPNSDSAAKNALDGLLGYFVTPVYFSHEFSHLPGSTKHTVVARVVQCSIMPPIRRVLRLHDHPRVARRCFQNRLRLESSKCITYTLLDPGRGCNAATQRAPPSTCSYMTYM